MPTRPGVLAVFLAALAWPAGAHAALVLQDGRFLASPQVTPPDDVAPGWRAVTLPDRWRGDRSALRHGWYRFHVELPDPPRERWAVYLPQLNMNAAVWLNGAELGDGGRFEEPIARNNYRPLLFAAQASLWRAGDNVIDVRLASYPRYGALAPVHAGPEAELRPLYERRLRWHVHVPVALFAVSVAIAAFMLALWWRRRQDSRYAWFGLSTAALAVFTLHLFLRDIPVPAKAWWWMVYTALDLWVVALALFVHRSLGVRRPALEAAFWAYLAGASAAYAISSIERQGVLMQVLVLGRVVIAAYLFALCGGHWWRSRNREALLYGLAIGVILAVGLRDVLLRATFQTALRPGWLGWEQDFYLTHYLGPGVAIVLAWFLARRFVAALDDSERLNRELESRVHDARAELDLSYAAVRELEKRQVEQDTRERIHRDLHDDVGAKLLSLVLRAPDRQSADLARSALEDLRDSVSRSRSEPVPLSDALDDWHAECSQRLDALGIALEWSAPEPPPERMLRPEAFAALSRVLREAVSNAIRHAAPERIECRVETGPEALRLRVAHGGTRIDPAQWRPGRGIGGMRSRVAALRGRIEWSLQGAQLVVVLEAGWTELAP